MHTTLKLFNPSIVGELYNEDQCEQDLYERMGYVIRYYREGHAFHVSQRDNVSQDEYKDCMDFLEKLKKLAEDMMTDDRGSLIFYRHRDNLKLNVSPLYTFLESISSSDFKSLIRVIKGRIHDYMHAGNFQYVAESYDVMDRWEFFIDELKETNGY